MILSRNLGFQHALEAPPQLSLGRLVPHLTHLSPTCGPHHHRVPVTGTSTQPVCSSVLAHGSVIQNVLISSAFKELLVPAHYLSDKSQFFLCGSMGFCIFTGHVYTLCYSHTFLTFHKNFNSSKRALVPPASPPCSAQASSHYSLRTEDLKGSARLLSTAPVRFLYVPATQDHLNSINQAFHTLIPLYPISSLAGMAFCPISAEQIEYSYSTTMLLTASLDLILLSQCSLRPS